MLRFIVSRQEMVYDVGINNLEFVTLDIDLPELEQLLISGSTGPGGFEKWQLLGVEIIKEDDE